MKIRQEQLEVFERAAEPSFEDRMLRYLRLHFSRECEFLGEETVRNTIRHGQERAARHRLARERSLRLYLGLVFALGCNFDQDPQMPWAAQVLKDPNLKDEPVRIDRLYERAEQYLQPVQRDYEAIEAGPEQSGLMQELRRLPRESSAALCPAAIPEFSRRLIGRLGKVLPEKCNYLGERLLCGLIEHGIRAAGQHGITSERGILTYVLLMFVFGSGFDTDPSLPWAAAVLKGGAAGGPNAKADRLYAAALDCLKAWWGIKESGEAEAGSDEDPDRPDLDE